MFKYVNTVQNKTSRSFQRKLNTTLCISFSIFTPQQEFCACLVILRLHKKEEFFMMFCPVFRMKRANSLNVLNAGTRESQDGAQVSRLYQYYYYYYYLKE